MTRRIGVMTSGGDAQGMNAAVRAIVRAGIHAGVEVFAVQEGWQGAIEGGEQIVQLYWSDVSGILPKGGTMIGTARSPEFRTREGQLTAVENLIERGHRPAHRDRRRRLAVRQPRALPGLARTGAGTRRGRQADT